MRLLAGALLAAALLAALFCLGGCGQQQEEQGPFDPEFAIGIVSSDSSKEAASIAYVNDFEDLGTRTELEHAIVATCDAPPAVDGGHLYLAPAGLEGAFEDHTIVDVNLATGYANEYENDERQSGPVDIAMGDGAVYTVANAGSTTYVGRYDIDAGTSNVVEFDQETYGTCQSIALSKWLGLGCAFDDGVEHQLAVLDPITLEVRDVQKLDVSITALCAEETRFLFTHAADPATDETDTQSFIGVYDESVQGVQYYPVEASVELGSTIWSEQGDAGMLLVTYASDQYLSDETSMLVVYDVAAGNQSNFELPPHVLQVEKASDAIYVMSADSSSTEFTLSSFQFDGRELVSGKQMAIDSAVAPYEFTCFFMNQPV